jgi:hypothetical protein
MCPATGSRTSAMVGDPDRHWWWRCGKPRWYCCSCRHYRHCGGCCSYSGCCCCRYRCRRCSCQVGEAAPRVAAVERAAFCWSRMSSEQQLDRRCPGGFPPSWYPPGCGSWRRWCRRTTEKCHGLRGRGRRGSGDQLLGGGQPFEIGGGGLLLIKELTGGQNATTGGDGLLLGSGGH